jgi:soluble lytic murein transglycosylase
MRGIGQTLSRLPAARAFIAGAALLAGAMVSAAQAQPTGSGNGDETAMALPRNAMHGGGVALPHPLAPSEAIRVRRVFALQERGNLAEAMRETALLSDTTLLGDILAQRYLGRFHRSSVAELTDWMARFSDRPDAAAIRDLLIRRDPKSAASVPAPRLSLLANEGLSDPVPEDADPPDRRILRNPVLDRSVAERAREGNTDAALRLVAGTRGLSAVYGMQLRAEIAQILFTQNRDEEALSTAAAAMRRGHADEQVALAGYVAGLAAWRLDRPDIARGYFERAAVAPIATAAQRAAAAFWVARAHVRTGDPAGYVPSMRRAAQEKRSFHGLLARSILGLPYGFSRSRDVLGEADVEAIAALPQGLRAFALLQVGQADRAEAELRGLWPLIQESAGLRRSLLLVAKAAGLTELTAQLAALVQVADGQPRDELRFPVPKLKPRGGFRVDPALIYALTQLESNFDTTAVSPMGARGLMQIMPVTAQYISARDAAGDASLDTLRLHEPALNLELGQRYLAYLAEQEGIGGDLIRILASYNSGPGGFARWAPGIRHGGDPLLFIEAIPNAETRRYVQHALTYTWIYAARLELPAPSLAELAAGKFPRLSGGEGTAVTKAAVARLN